MLILQDVSKKLLTSLLIFQLTLPLPTWAAGNNASESDVDYHSIARVEEGAQAPKPKDLYHLVGQKLLEVTVDVSEAEIQIQQIHAEHNLDGLDLTVPTEQINNPIRQVRFFYDKNLKALIMIKVEKGVVKKGLRTVAHVISNLNITSNLLIEEGFLGFATSGGRIEGALWPLFTKSIFSAPIPIMTLADNPPIQGMEVTKLEILDRVSKPRPLRSWDDPTSEVGDFLVGDLGLHIQFHSPSTAPGEPRNEEADIRLDRSRVLASLDREVGRLILYLAITNPNLDYTDEILQLTKQYAAEIQAAMNEDPLYRSVLGNEASEIRNPLVHLAQRGDFKLLTGLAKKTDGKAPLATLSLVDREYVPTQTWEQQFAHIQEVTLALAEAAQQRGEAIPDWREALRIYSSLSMNTSGATAAGIKSADPMSMAFDRSLITQLNGTDRVEKLADLWSAHEKRLRSLAVQKITKPAVRGAAILAATGALAVCTEAACQKLIGWSPLTWSASLGTDILAAALDGAKAVGDWYLVRDIVHPITSGTKFFTDSYKTWMVVAGTAIALAYIPAGLFTAKILAKMQKKPWGAQKAFFTYGMKIAAALNVPPQKLVADLLGAKLLYPALVAQVDPIDHPRTMQPLLSDAFGGAARKEAAAKAVRQQVTEASDRKSRALLIAASIACQRSGDNILTLLRLSRGEQLSELSRISRDLPEGQKLSELAIRIEKGLRELNDRGVSALEPTDTALIQEYLEFFNNERAKLEKDNNTPKLLQAANWVGSTYMGYARETARFLAFGEQLYRNHLKFKNVDMTDHQVRKAGSHFIYDYGLTAMFGAITLPTFFFELPRLGADGWKGMFNQAEQLGLYGLLSGQDSVATEISRAVSLSNPYDPLLHYLMAPHRQKTMSLGQSIQVIVDKALLDPNAPSVFGYQYRSMVNNLSASLFRLLVGWGPRAGAMLGAAWATNQIPGLDPASAATLAAAGMVVLNAGIGTATMNFSKITANFGPLYGDDFNHFFGPSAHGVTPGYTFLVWPTTYWAQDLAKSRSDENLKLLKDADFNLIEGIQRANSTMIYNGIQTHISVLNKQKIPVPEPFKNLTVERCNPEIGRAFTGYLVSLGGVIPTQTSHTLDFGVNFYGTVLSSALAAGAAQMLMDPRVNSTLLLKLLGASVASVGLTLPLVSLAPKVTIPASRILGSLCNRILKRDPVILGADGKPARK